MNKIITLLLAVVLMSCQTISQQSKEYNQVKSRTYQISYDSVLKRLVEFTSNSKISSKIVAVAPNLIIIDESFNDEQAYKYTDYVTQNNNSSVQDCQEKLFINIRSDSTKTIVDIESNITLTIAYNVFLGKAVESVNKNINCKSIGAREKEILDFINNDRISLEK